MVFNSLKETLQKGEKVKVSGFGNFLVRGKKERVGRNPQTGDQIKISARRVLTFRPSQVLKAMLNGEDFNWIPTRKLSHEADLDITESWFTALLDGIGQPQPKPATAH